MLIRRPLLAKVAGFCVMAALAVAVLGCSGGGPVTYNVSGKVTYKGEPVADAQVGFVPDGGPPEQKPASGQTDAQGNFSLTTYVTPKKQSSGAMLGKYKVTVFKPPATPYDPYAPGPKPKPLLPEPYAGAATTKLAAEVTSGGSNKFDFTLEETP